MAPITTETKPLVEFNTFSDDNNINVKSHHEYQDATVDQCHTDKEVEHDGSREQCNYEHDRVIGSTQSVVSLEELNHVRRLLYISHVFEQFSEKAWVFAIVLFMAYVTDYQSLTLVSTYGLISNGAVCLLASQAGQYIDTESNRLTAAQFFIWTENICVILASTLCYLLLHNKEQSDNEFNVLTDSYSITLLVGIHIIGSIAQVLDGGFLVAIERDWVVVLGQVALRCQLEQQHEQQHEQQSDIVDDDDGTGIVEMSSVSKSNTTNGLDEKSSTSIPTTECSNSNSSSTVTNHWLSETNVCMKQIDLSCEVIAPAVAGLFIDSFGSNRVSIAAIAISFINILSLVMEYICTAQIYQLVPELAKPKHVSTNATTNNDPSTSPTGTDTNNNCTSTTTTTTPTIPVTQCVNTIVDQQQQQQHPLITYFQQPVWSAGIGLAMLYFNALTFGGLMISYLLYRGMDLSTVGTLRGVSSAIGLTGTCIFQYSLNRTMSLPKTGMWSILYQFVCITASMVSMYINDYSISISLFIVGVCTSRIGLFVYEITVIQLMQEHIPELIRGKIGGIQNSFNAFFQLSSFALCLLYTNPKDFIVVVGAGYGAVGIAAILFGFGIYNNRTYYETNLSSSSSFYQIQNTSDNDDDANDNNDTDDDHDNYDLTLYYDNNVRQNCTHYELTTV